MVWLRCVSISKQDSFLVWYDCGYIYIIMNDDDCKSFTWICTQSSMSLDSSMGWLSWGSGVGTNQPRNCRR